MRNCDIFFLFFPIFVNCNLNNTFFNIILLKMAANIFMTGILIYTDVYGR